MFERNEKITKAYSGRVRSSRLLGEKRTQGEYTDNYYQAVAGKAPAVVALAAALQLLIHRFQSRCSASGPSTSRCDLKSHFANSSNARRAVGDLPPTTKGFREGFAKAFRTVPPTVSVTQ
ncbi:hypothetical protein [Stenotrophomonas sp.]|uniref:hypothetical protein n=1 Tax=Stenotrophomonas sp. TaxID=69392 RepID=UPI0028ACF44A|nr:hypothetical protein [Stenotrophomonas sp.]